MEVLQLDNINYRCSRAPEWMNKINSEGNYENFLIIQRYIRVPKYEKISYYAWSTCYAADKDLKETKFVSYKDFIYKTSINYHCFGFFLSDLI